MNQQVELKKRQVEFGSNILGMISLIILGNILGDNGVVYIAFAFEVYLFFRTIISSGFSDTLGRLLRGRTSKGQYKNAAKLKRNAFVLETAVGAAVSVLVLAIAGIVGERLLGIRYCTAMICILAPGILLHAMVSILLGYFQAEGTELPTVISYVMRQVCIFLFALLFSKLLGEYGRKVSALLRQENFTAMYSGMGVALAITISELLVLLFLFLVYRSSRTRGKKGTGEGMRITDTFGSQTGAVLSSMYPTMLIAVCAHLPIWLGILFYEKSAADAAGLELYGVYYGKYLPLVGILYLVICILILPNCYRTVSCIRRDEQRYAKNQFGGGLHAGIAWGAFAAFFVAVMAEPVADIIGVADQGIAQQMLRFGAFWILFAIAGFYFSEILLLLNGKFWVLGAVALKDIFFVISALLLLNGGKAGILSLVVAGMIGELCYAALTGVLLYRQLHQRPDLVRHLAIPIAAACVIGLILFFVGKAITPHLGSLVSILLCLVPGVCCYLLILLFLRNFTEQELHYVPGGKLLSRIGQLLRIY